MKINQVNTNRYILAIRALLIFIFMYAGVSKAIIFPQFIVQLSESPLIPANLVSVAAFFIIGIEFLLCFMLASKKFFHTGLLASYSLMLFFTLYVLYILKLAPNIPCSCGGILGKLDHSYHLLFNVVITLLIVPTLFLHKPLVVNTQHSL